VPIINKQDLGKEAGAAPGLETCLLVSAGQGSQSLHIEEVTVAPNARIPRSINPHAEVAVIVQAGRLDVVEPRDSTAVILELPMGYWEQDIAAVFRSAETD